MGGSSTTGTIQTAADACTGTCSCWSALSGTAGWHAKKSTTSRGRSNNLLCKPTAGFLGHLYRERTTR
ncbi:hypothetical protein C8T65DRAFT_236072 [Cerioporus squamosus]|nr:hypothetical protein C8T65DRAFT_236072 [Cerioporus squamosus]